MSGVIDCDDEATLAANLGQAGGKLVVIDFHALWCGPCKAIAPKLKEFAQNYPEVVFLKVDVDKCQEAAQRYQVSAMPTFKFVLQGRVVETVKGANPAKLEEAIVKHSAPVNQTPEGASPVPGMADLEQFIVERSCLNESDEHPAKWVFEDNRDLFLESDCDPEILLSVSFNQKMKLHSLVVRSPPGGHAPKTTKLFINQPNAMDFDSAREGKPLQEIVLSEEQTTEGSVVNLKFVKLQAVDNVTLFFADNQGDEETTRIERVIFYGKTVSTTNMGDFKRVAGKAGESH